MPHDVNPVWVLKSSFYAARWSAWLAARRAPDLSEWAETRAERDALRGYASVAYRVPSKMPPVGSDDEAREALYGHIRFRLGMTNDTSKAA